MRLNGSALNRRGLNAGRRLPVCGAGQAITNVTAELSATRILHGAGVAEQYLDGDLAPSAIRNAAGSWVTVFDARLAQTVARIGRGQAVLALATDLFYSRTVHGFATAVLELELLGHVGVVFIDGQAEIHPMQAGLAASKRMMGKGAAAFSMDGALAPSAIRQVVAELVPLELGGTLEASHVDAQGVRHVGFAGTAPIGLEVRDAGMLRQAFIGSLDFELQGSGSGSLIKPTLAGGAVLGLGMAGAFHAIRQVHGEAVLQTQAEADGAVIVRGEGSATLALFAYCTGYKRTYPGLDATIVSIGSAMDGLRVTRGDGSAAIGLNLTGTGVRRRVGKAVAVLELLGESDSYLNPTAEDPTEETFSRLFLPRDFTRLATPREWRR
ncbi:hypothetical protein [Pseudomonas anguilliseptica]|uniref:hypothetical protein n=1 Tax=Pseudomonas anguilliseptica TaxID=53406 RepID=UPI00325A763F